MPLTQLQTNATSLPDASGQPTMLSGRFTEGTFTELLGKYSELARRGLLWTISNQAAQAVSVALTTTYTGLCVSNPNGSGRNLHVLGYSYGLTVAPAGIASLHIIRGYSTTDVVHGTPLAAPGPVNALIGSSNTTVAKADTAATLPAGIGAGIPAYGITYSGGFTAAALPSPPMGWMDVAGAMIIGPGGYAAAGALTAVTGFASFLIADLPV